MLGPADAPVQRERRSGRTSQNDFAWKGWGRGAAARCWRPGPLLVCLWGWKRARGRRGCGRGRGDGFRRVHDGLRCCSLGATKPAGRGGHFRESGHQRRLCDSPSVLSPGEAQDDDIAGTAHPRAGRRPVLGGRLPWRACGHSRGLHHPQGHPDSGMQRLESTGFPWGSGPMHPGCAVHCSLHTRIGSESLHAR